MSNSELFLSLLLVTAVGMQFALAKEGFKCRNATMDCDVNECCAGRSPKTLGVCQPQPQVGDRCTTRIKPGAKICPCPIGTTCTVRYTRKVSPLLRRLDVIKQYSECALLPPQSTDEQEET